MKLKIGLKSKPSFSLQFDYSLSIALGEESPAISGLNPLIGDGIEEARRRLLSNLGAPKSKRATKAKTRERSPAKSVVHDLDSSSDDERERIRSRSRRRSRSRSSVPTGTYAEYNWVMLEQYWPLDQRPAVPYQGYLHYISLASNI